MKVKKWITISTLSTVLIICIIIAKMIYYINQNDITPPTETEKTNLEEQSVFIPSDITISEEGFVVIPSEEENTQAVAAGENTQAVAAE